MTTSNNSKKVWIYTRISALKTKSTDASIDAQLALGMDFAAKNGYEVAGTFQEVKSGGKTSNRPEFNRCISEAKKSKGIIWVYSISRASRSVIDFLSLVQSLKTSGASIVSHSEDLRSDTASSELMIGILAQFAEFERKLAGERTRNALRNLKENGKKYCRKIPYGKKENSKGEFLNNQKEQKVISRMRYLRIEGMTFQKIADVLNDEKILPREGGTWKKQVISKILKRTASEPCQTAPAMAK